MHAGQSPGRRLCRPALQYGILIILAQVIGALGLPYALCIFPLHAFRHFFNRTPMKYSFGEGLVPALNLDPM